MRYGLFDPDRSGYISFTEDVDTFLEDTRLEAEKGSVDHQLLLGRHFIKLACANDSPGVNGLEGVGWLAKASKNGNDEATNLLRGCLEDKIGIFVKCYFTL